MAKPHIFESELNYPNPATAYSGSRNYLAPIGFALGISDFLSVIIIPAFGCYFTSRALTLQKNVLFWNLLAAITVSAVACHGGYRKEVFLDVNKSVQLAIRCYLATVIPMLAAALLLGHQHAVSRYWTTAEICFAPVLLTLARTLPATEVRRACDQLVANGPIVICFDRSPRNISKALAEQQIFAKISGIFYLSPAQSEAEASDWPIITTVRSLLDQIGKNNVQDIVFVYQPELELISAAARQELLSQLLTYPARVWLAFNLQPQLPDMLANRSGHYKLVPIVTDNLVNSRNTTKRIFDFLTSLMLLLLSLPLLAIIAATVRLSGPGPVVFRQIRTGAHDHHFTVLKFRTMNHAAGSTFAQARRNDPRVTWIGRFLRRSSLDEMLQLINVLKGDMSMVGPRPHAPETQVEGITFEDAVKLYRLRYRVRPGITGLAQIRGQRGETRLLGCLEQRISSDLEYIETWSIWLDIKILLRTVPAVIFSKNAC